MLITTTLILYVTVSRCWRGDMARIIHELASINNRPYPTTSKCISPPSNRTPYCTQPSTPQQPPALLLPLPLKVRSSDEVLRHPTTTSNPPSPHEPPGRF